MTARPHTVVTRFREDAITSDAPTPPSPLERLRDELDRDAQLLQALTPGSEAHQRLSARVDARTQELLDRMDEKDAADRRYREAMRAQHARPPAFQLSEAAQNRLAGGLFVLIGGVIAYIAWGTWWLALAIVMIVLGLISLFVHLDS